MIIIILRGYSGAGKDTVGKCLTDAFGFKRFAFADSLKRLVAQKYELDVSLLHTDIGKVYWRPFIIEEGAVQRLANPRVFADGCADEISESGMDRVVITDWRYPNEYDVIRERFPDAKIITCHVKRIGQESSPVHNLNEYLLTGFTCDVTIMNDGCSDLTENVREVFRLSDC